MSPARLTWLILTALVFAAWAVLAFRTLFHLRRRAQERTGRALNGPGVAIAVARGWLGNPETRRGRTALAFLTVAVLGMAALGAVLP